MKLEDIALVHLDSSLTGQAWVPLCEHFCNITREYWRDLDKDVLDLAVGFEIVLLQEVKNAVS